MSYYKGETDRILGILALATVTLATEQQAPEYLELFDLAADALRRSAAERIQENYGRLTEWGNLTEWQRAMWRNQFARLLREKREEIAQLQDREIHSGPEA